MGVAKSFPVVGLVARVTLIFPQKAALCSHVWQAEKLRLQQELEEQELERIGMEESYSSLEEKAKGLEKKLRLVCCEKYCVDNVPFQCGILCSLLQWVER